MREHPIVLISPAMAIGSAYYRPLVESFERVGWDAIALPRRGFEKGLPSAGRDHDWSYGDEIDEIAVAVRTAREERPERPVILLGHSLGGQMIAGHELGERPADGVVTVGSALPWFPHFPYAGLPLAFMAAAIVPVTTSLFGHLPKPAFGAPGARTLMREWARMVLTGTPPFRADRPIATPSLLVSLEGDDLSPSRAVDALAKLFDSSAVTRWHRMSDEVPEGDSNDHITWVRSPDSVVERIVHWWAQLEAPSRV